MTVSFFVQIMNFFLIMTFLRGTQIRDFHSHGLSYFIDSVFFSYYIIFFVFLFCMCFAYLTINLLIK